MLLIWAIATRRQLERWEPLVRDHIRAVLSDDPPSEAGIWDASIEHQPRRAGTNDRS